MRTLPFAVVGVAIFASTVHADDSSDAASTFLKVHCQVCHSGEKPKGDFRADKLTADFTDRTNRDHWLAALEQLKAGTMPPRSKPRPPQKDIQALQGWVAAEAAAAAAKRMAEGRTVLRRLNRVEYENTVRDLLGVEIELKELLPPDTSANGFDNNGEALHISSFLMDRYLEAAEAALNVAIVNGPQPPYVKKRFSLRDHRLVKTPSESVYLVRDEEVVLFSSSPWNAITVEQFYPPDRGRYRIRISASGYQSSEKPITYRVDAGPMLMGTKNHLVGYFDVPASKPTVVEFVDHFEAKDHIRIHPYGLAVSQTVTKTGAEKYPGHGLAVQWIEVEGPLHDAWPPESHRRIFGKLEQKAAPIFNNSKRVEVVSQYPEADAARILRGFAHRAFRRTVTDADIKPYLELVRKKLAAKQSFEQAMRVGLKAVMVSPEFLYLREKPGKLDEFALASRLSYFLWSTMPDEELLLLAEKGKLTESLAPQVERMLKHAKAAAFTENFVGQWLGLRDINFTAPDFRLYQEFDEMLKEAMVKETHLFFDEVLTKDLRLTNFVASDFTFLNERIAKHYGITGVEGLRHRKVTLTPESHRGGVLTMASVLKVTANGTSTSPVTRGAWVLDRIMGTPPSPPPSGVSAVEPDIRGATTIREQLAKHRQIATCATCHTKIDPPGFALESFDVIGGWRDYYRSVGNGKPVTIDGKRMMYNQGKPVDAEDVMATGEKFANIDEFKQILLKDKDQLAHALALHLMNYATGGNPLPSDRAEIDAIVRKVREKNYGFRTLLHEVVQSKLFQTK